MRSHRFLVAILALSIVVPAVYGRTKPAPTAPGTYKEWGQDIDEIEIIKTFKTADYDKIVVPQPVADYSTSVVLDRRCPHPRCHPSRRMSLYLRRRRCPILKRSGTER